MIDMATANSILCIGRNRRNQELLSQVLIKAGYAVEVAFTYEALTTVNQGQSLALILLDVTGFDRRVWQSCRELNERAIPTFIITPSDSAHLPARHVPGGTVLTKPLGVQSLLTLIAHTLEGAHG